MQILLQCNLRIITTDVFYALSGIEWGLYFSVRIDSENKIEGFKKCGLITLQWVDGVLLTFGFVLLQ